MSGDKILARMAMGTGFIPVLIVFALMVILFQQSLPALQVLGIRFFSSQVWDPVAGDFGVLSFLYGTLVSSCLALVIATPLGIGVALFLSELAPRMLRGPVAFLVELLAAIPSIVYGLWGLFFLVPWLRDTVEPPLIAWFGFLPFFRGPPYGIGMFASGIILAIMILPIISSICREVFDAVPNHQREAAFALGATRWEMTTMAVVRYAFPGVLGALFLGLGRALGETMAVTMLIGNRPEISVSLFSPGHTMAAVIANEYAEASGDLHLSALTSIGLILFVITFAVNAGARFLVWRVRRGPKGVRI